MVIFSLEKENVDLEIQLEFFFVIYRNFIVVFMGSLYIVIYYCYGLDLVGVDCWEVEKGWEYEVFGFVFYVEKRSQKNYLWFFIEEMNY